MNSNVTKAKEHLYLAVWRFLYIKVEKMVDQYSFQVSFMISFASRAIFGCKFSLLCLHS